MREVEMRGREGDVGRKRERDRVRDRGRSSKECVWKEREKRVM